MTYLPAAFVQEDPLRLRELMRASPLAVLAAFGDGRLQVSHVPLLLDEGDGMPAILRGHLARANPLAQYYDPAVEAVAVFSGPDAYVSPSSYATKRETGKVVPTWNYAAVYAYGTLCFLDEPEQKHAVVSALTREHEAALPAPWAVSDAPADFVESQLRAVRAFEFHVTRLEGKWKLSQNRTQADRNGVIAALGESPAKGSREVHEAMRRHYGAGD